MITMENDYWWDEEIYDWSDIKYEKMNRKYPNVMEEEVETKEQREYKKIGKLR